MSYRKAKANGLVTPLCGHPRFTNLPRAKESMQCMRLDGCGMENNGCGTPRRCPLRALPPRLIQQVLWNRHEVRQCTASDHVGPSRTDTFGAAASFSA